MLHDVLVWVHAALATVSFAAGLAVSFKYLRKRWLFMIYLSSLVGMTIAVVAAVSVGWREFALGAKIAFSGLIVLAFYMLWRAIQARQELIAQESGWHDRVIGHAGFTLISYFEGFVIVALLNAGGPVWLVAIVAVLGILGGQQVINLAQRRAGQAVG